MASTRRWASIGTSSIARRRRQERADARERARTDRFSRGLGQLQDSWWRRPSTARRPSWRRQKIGGVKAGDPAPIERLLLSDMESVDARVRHAARGRNRRWLPKLRNASRRSAASWWWAPRTRWVQTVGDDARAKGYSVTRRRRWSNELPVTRRSRHLDRPIVAVPLTQLPIAAHLAVLREFRGHRARDRSPQSRRSAGTAPGAPNPSPRCACSNARR